MAVGMFGADLGQLEALAQVFNREWNEVVRLKATITQRVGREATAWTGPGADKFRSAWETEFSPALDKLSTALEEAEFAVRQYRNNIERATA